MQLLGKATRAAAMTATVGAAGLAYSAGFELHAFTLRRYDVRVLPPGSRPLRILQVSDLHMTPYQRKKTAWLRGLAALEPDLVIDTGDNLSHRGGIPTVLEALDPLLDFPGVFVMGSNDYFEPVFKNPALYLLRPDRQPKPRKPEMPWHQLRDGFLARGWLDLTNRRQTVEVGGLTLAFAGVDDPHLRYDDLPAVAGPPADADLAIGVSHAPYLRVLNQFTADGYPLLIMGHTHGGQLRVPFYGALVTNCDLDRKRARGLHRHSYGGRSSWLHVSAGLGTSMYAPVRFACRPEATLLTLRAKD